MSTDVLTSYHKLLAHSGFNGENTGSHPVDGDGASSGCYICHYRIRGCKCSLLTCIMYPTQWHCDFAISRLLPSLKNGNAS